MQTDKFNILASWEENALAWIETIQNNEIRSRELITNQAIVEAILSTSPSTVLDAGCGEGWLCRELNKYDIYTVGIDGVSALIEQARKLGKGNYFTISYEDILQGKSNGLSLYDAIVFNYSIFEKESTIDLFEIIKTHLNINGKIIIQTISPKNELFAERPENGWMTEHWDGLNDKYKTAFNWYYRSEKEWLGLFEKTGFKLLNKRAVIHTETGKFFSVIYVVEKQMF